MTVLFSVTAYLRYYLTIYLYNVSTFQICIFNSFSMFSKQLLLYSAKAGFYNVELYKNILLFFES